MSVAIITGASSGIGRATALALAAEGHRVALLARRGGLLDEVAEEVSRLGGEALAIATDVTDPDAVDQAVRQILDEWERIDVAVANAGVRPEGRITDLTLDDVHRAMDVNYFGAVHLTRAVWPSMQDRGDGHLIYVNSLDGRWSNRLEGPYVASKHALLGYAGVARKEYGDFGVAVTSILAGRVDTPMIAHLAVPPIQPKLPPDRVAEAILRAIDKRPAEIVVPPLRGRLLILTGVLFPRFADRIADLLGIQGKPR